MEPIPAAVVQSINEQLAQYGTPTGELKRVESEPHLYRHEPEYYVCAKWKDSDGAKWEAMFGVYDGVPGITAI